MKINCLCQNSNIYVANPCKDYSNAIKRFSCLRENCLVLKEIIFPDDIWTTIQGHFSQFDKAGHQSNFFGAYINKCLHKLTYPLHNFLIDKETGKIRKDVSKQYLNDLKEKWMNQKYSSTENEGNNSLINDCYKQFPTEMGRHNHARGYYGKLMELLFANKLKGKGYEIRDLEAWQSKKDTEKKTDILAYKQENYQIEVKYIGMENEDFYKIYLTENGGGPYGPQEIKNYTLFRICESARQLLSKANLQGKKIVVIIIDQLILWKFGGSYLCEKGVLIEMDLHNPEFQKYDKLKSGLLAKPENEKKKTEYENIFSNPEMYVSKLDGIWIFRYIYPDIEFDLKLQHGIEY